MTIPTLRFLLTLWSPITTNEIHRLFYTEIFRRYLIRKAISHLFLKVDVLHRLIVSFTIISMLSIFHEKWLSLYPLLSIPKYLSRGLEILLYIRGGRGIYVYWLMINRFLRSQGLLLLKDTLFELNFSFTASSWLNNFLRR